MRLPFSADSGWRCLNWLSALRFYVAAWQRSSHLLAHHPFVILVSRRVRSHCFRTRFTNSLHSTADFSDGWPLRQPLSFYYWTNSSSFLYSHFPLWRKFPRRTAFWREYWLSMSVYSSKHNICWNSGKQRLAPRSLLKYLKVVYLNYAHNGEYFESRRVDIYSKLLDEVEITK